MRPCVLSRRSFSYAAPLPVLNPCGVGLCWTMKLYQSITHTWPSGPTVVSIGADHSSSLATRFHPYLAANVAPVGRRGNVAARWPVGSHTNAVRFQYAGG